MLTIGELVVDLSPNSEKFVCQLRKAQASLNSTAAQMNDNLRAIKSGFDTVASAAASFGVGVDIADVACEAMQTAPADCEASDLAFKVTEIGLADAIRACEEVGVRILDPEFNIVSAADALNRIAKEMGDSVPAHGPDSPWWALHALVYHHEPVFEFDFCGYQFTITGAGSVAAAE